MAAKKTQTDTPTHAASAAGDLPPAASSVNRGWKGWRAMVALLVIGGGIVISLNADSSLRVSDVKSDESVLLFPTAGHFDTATNEWQVDFHGWIFEPEQGDWIRGQGLSEIKRQLDLDDATSVGAVFTERVGQFLVDNERGKHLVLSLNEVTYPVGPSESNGHFQGTAKLKLGDPLHGMAPRVIQVGVVLKSSDKRVFSSPVLLIPAQGVSVISDIDDTIKISNVRDREELMRRTLFTKFESVPEMSTIYQQWSQQGAAFHYVSNSPWQLYSPIAQMLSDEMFPAGTVHLRQFRLKDGSFVRFLREGSAAKRNVIESLLKRWPERKFVLVGDSGEQDPEVYGAIGRDFPTQIAYIAIRNASDEDPQGERFQTAFKDVPATSWVVFTNPLEIQLPDIQTLPSHHPPT